MSELPNNLILDLYDSVEDGLQLAVATKRDVEDISNWFTSWQRQPTPTTTGSFWLRTGRIAIWSFDGPPPQ